MIRRHVLAAGLAGLLGPSQPARASAGRLVTIGGAVTETVFALGQGGRIVAVDSTSRFPAQVGALAQVGYLRALAPEGLMGLAPDLMLVSEEAGPAQALSVLRAAGAPLAMVPDEAGIEAVNRKILAVAQALSADGGALNEAVTSDWRRLDSPIASLRPVVAVFILSVARGAPLVAGRDTHADAMLLAAGARNAVRSFAGYRPLSAETAASLAPDAIVMMDHALIEAGGVDAVLRIPALAVTPAARTRRVIALDGAYMLGFGPRAAHARRDLARLLHRDADLPALPARSWT
ncbi:heme/hemin ABC transporter substrate-binding protein [Falsiroseomonas sp.]|uniref:heme/hemin ABC transporter substrate-binding protein n=1 Tax=Falsiroseomonas sp. TaxID=2870721 RepID=UPI003F6FC832